MSAVSLDLLVSAWDEGSEAISPANSQLSRNACYFSPKAFKEDEKVLGVMGTKERDASHRECQPSVIGRLRIAAQKVILH